MRAEVIPGHDVHTLYVWWEVIPEGREKGMLAALGGPVVLELEASCVVEQNGTKQPTTRLKIPIWPYPGERNLGQARFYDVDSRRRFWVSLQDAVGTLVVDWLFEARPGSLKAAGATGKTFVVPERGRPVAPPSAVTPAATPLS